LFGVLVLVLTAPDAIRGRAVTDGVLMGGAIFLVGLLVSVLLIRAGMRRRRSERDQA